MVYKKSLRKLWDDMLTHVMKRNAASTSSSDHSSGGTQQMFGDNIVVQGGNFTIANGVRVANAERAGFKILQQNVTPSAFHNSAQRVDPPRCHPETRIEILESIFHWITQSKDRDHWLLWLNGAAGAGKSAIMQTTAERCILDAIAIASFFFGRSDARRNTMDHLVATLAYQLIKAIPNTVDGILSSIENDPLIFQQSLEFQLQQLIIQPLLHLPFTLHQPFVVFIDGLDECLDRTHQSNLIKVFGEISMNQDVPIIFLVASRREAQILSAFSADGIENLLEIVPLDESEASDDIRWFLNARFSKICQSHIHRKYLPANWPPISMVSEIVDKASGQFIYASVVINYVSSPHANPARQLEIIRDLRLKNPSSEHPFAHLDSLYRHIFSQVENLDAVQDILAFYIITNLEWITIFEPIVGDLEVLLADLTPVLQVRTTHIGHTKIKFLHASLPDFLQDPLRSQKYFLNLETHCIKLLCMFLKRQLPDPLLPIYNWKDIAQQEVWKLNGIELLLEKAKESDQLQSAVTNFNPTFHHIKVDNNWHNTCSRVKILASLKKLPFGDQNHAYKHVLDIFAEGYAKFWSFHFIDVKDKVRKSPDLCAQICRLHPELALQPSLDLSQEGEELWKKTRGW